MQTATHSFFSVIACFFMLITIFPNHSLAEYTIEPVDPPLQEFYTKQLNCDGIYVRSSSAVEDKALLLACDKINLMLANIPYVRAALMQQGSAMHIIGKKEQTTDLPEYKDKKYEYFYSPDMHEITTLDKRARGLGGLICVCPEENILHLPYDSFGPKSDICIHEFAHTIMNHGLMQEQVNAIQKQYETSLEHSLWRGSYAASNVQEFWAELSTWYFGFEGETRMYVVKPRTGPEGLKAYDPDSFALLGTIYGNQAGSEINSLR
jgi:hypothetical protein